MKKDLQHAGWFSGLFSSNNIPGKRRYLLRAALSHYYTRFAEFRKEGISIKKDSWFSETFASNHHESFLFVFIRNICKRVSKSFCQVPFCTSHILTKLCLLWIRNICKRASRSFSRWPCEFPPSKSNWMWSLDVHYYTPYFLSVKIFFIPIHENFYNRL